VVQAEPVWQQLGQQQKVPLHLSCGGWAVSRVPPYNASGPSSLATPRWGLQSHQQAFPTPILNHVSKNTECLLCALAPSKGPGLGSLGSAPRKQQARGHQPMKAGGHAALGPAVLCARSLVTSPWKEWPLPQGLGQLRSHTSDFRATVLRGPGHKEVTWETGSWTKAGGANHEE
jgi:hypothetical protein